MSEQKPNLDSLFEAALQFEAADERAAFLDEACCRDPALRQEVERLLRSHQHAGSFLESPPAELDADSPDKGGNHDLTQSLEAGLSPTFGRDAAIFIGRNDHSILKILAGTMTVPHVVLRDDGDAGPVQKLSSPEIPARDGASRYQLQGEIARGGMGAILKGRDIDLGRDLAIKVLLEEHRERPEVIQRFVEEAQIGGQLQHPGIAPVYELGQFLDQRPFFSMKLVKGKTLAALLLERSDPSEDRSRFLGIFEQVCQTMAYAHSRGVIHRDLKSANIMVGAFGEVQVMDWGLAKVLPTGGVADEKKSRDKQAGQSVIQTMRSLGSDSKSPVGTVGSQTQIGSIMGTPAYMPPEQALGEIDNLDERADVFGLGAILCEILSGQPPYVAEDNLAIHRLACRGKLDGCMERLDSCQADPDLVKLAQDCLRIEPSQRPRDAGALANRVTSYLESVETKLREAELQRVAESTRAEEERKRRRVSMALAGSVLMFVLFGSGVWIHFVRREADNEKQYALTLKRNLNRQMLSAAFRAYQNRNVPQARAMLDQLSPQEGGAEWFARRFLDARCRESMGEVRELNHKVYARSAIDPQGRFYAAAVAPNEVALISLSGDLLASISFPKEGLKVQDHAKLTISRDGRWLLVPVRDADQTGRVLVWEIIASDNGFSVRLSEPSPRHEAGAVCADIDAGADFIVSIDNRGVIKKWSFSGDHELVTGQSDTGDEAGHIGITFSNDGKWVLSHHRRSVTEVTVWRSSDLKRLDSVPYGDQVSAICFSPDSNLFAIAGYRGTEVWGLNDGDPKRVHRLSWRRSCDCVFSGDGKFLVVCGSSDDTSIEVFSVDTGETVKMYHWPDNTGQYERIHVDEQQVFAIGKNESASYPHFLQTSISTQAWWYGPFATGGSKIAIPTADNRVRIIDVDTNADRVFDLDEPAGRIWSLALASDGDRIAVGYEAGGRPRVTVWNMSVRKQVYAENPPRPLTLRFSPKDSNILLIASGNDFTNKWATHLVNLETGKSVRLSDDAALGADFTKDGSQLLLGASPWNGSASSTLWSVPSDGSVRLTKQLDTSKNYSVAFRSDSKSFALLEDRVTNTVRIWDETGERSISPIHVSSPRLLSLDFSPGGECLVTASPNGQITFIDCENGKEVGVFRVDRPLRHIEFMDQCDQLVVSTMDGAVLHWGY